MTGFRWRAVLGIAVLLLAGCASTVTGAPAARPSAAPQVLEPGVPRVAHPRNGRGITACDLLTPAQLDGLGVDRSTARSSEQNSGLRCEWRTRDKLMSLEAVMAADLAAHGFAAGLSGLYIQRNTYDIFVPGELDGFPSVHADRSVNSDCSIYVGIADDQAFQAGAGSVTGDPKRCDVALKMASAILSNLPPLK